MDRNERGGVGVRVEGEIAIVTLERAAKLNALSTHLEERLLAALRSDLVRSSRVVVLTGSHTVFSAGADVDEIRDMTPLAIADYYRQAGSVYEELATLPQPTIAAIAGYCLGGGLELALSADIRVADLTATFGLPEVSLGIVPSAGGVTRLGKIVGTARALDLVLRGRRFDAAYAERIGLVTELVEPAGHLSAALSVAREIAGHPPLAVNLAKRALDAAVDSSRATSLLVEQLAYTVLSSRESGVGTIGRR
jgi:enoyl-CoA hydratase/carnithine racemase